MESYQCKGKWVPGSEKQTPLHVYDPETEAELIQCVSGNATFLENIEDINKIYQPSGHTALTVAANCGHFKLVQKILEKEPIVSQIHVNKLDYDDANRNVVLAARLVPMALGEMNRACVSGNIAKVKELIKVQSMLIAKPNAYGVPPLSAACAVGRLDVAKLLLENFVIQDDMSVFQFLEQQIKDAPDYLQHKSLNGLYSPLHECAAYGYKDGLQWLLSSGASSSCRDGRGDTPLHIASLFDQIDSATILIANGVDPNIPNQDRDTPLQCAAAGGSLACCMYLVTVCGVDPICAGHDGHTALHESCFHGQKEVAEFFMGHCGVDPELVDADGHTPFHEACYNGHLAMAQLLVSEYAINPFLEDQDGILPLNYAIRNGHTEIVEFLIEEVTVEHECLKLSANLLLDAILEGHLDLIKYLLKKFENDANPLAYVDKMGIHLGCFQGRFDCVEYMVSYVLDQKHDTAIQAKKMDALLNSSTKLWNDENTAIGYAVASNNKVLVRYLLELGARQPQAPQLQLSSSSSSELPHMAKTLNTTEMADVWGRLLWSKTLHWYQPRVVRDCVRTVLLVADHPNCAVQLPRTLWFEIMSNLRGCDFESNVLGAD